MNGGGLHAEFMIGHTPPHGAARYSSADLGALAALVVVAVAGFVTSPPDGGFWWTDAPRHALDGAFILDLLRDLPMADPVGYAYEYYLRYPALTVLFYPPLLHVVLAAAYAVFGVSALVAAGVEAVFHAGLLVALFVLARRWLRTPYALAAALLAGAGPEVLVWARQIMLDVPAYAWLVASAVAFVRWLDTDRPAALTAAAALLVAAIYTKYNAGFILIPYALAAASARGWTSLLSRRVVTTALVCAAALVPAAVLLVTFGGANIASVVGSQTTDLPRASLAAWTFYPDALPGQIGWPTIALAIWGAVVLRRTPSFTQPHRVFILAWAVVAYAIFSFIALREVRHSLMLLAPVAVLAMTALQHAERRLGRVAQVAALTLAVGTTAWGMFARPAPAVVGHAAAARIVAALAPRDANVLFSGYRDGNFIFAMRSLGATARTVRADKLLLRMFIARERGVEDRGYDRAALLELLRKHGLQYIVAEEDFWTDLPSLKALDTLLRDRTLFDEIARVPVESNTGSSTTGLRVLRYLGPMDSPPAPLTLEMVGLGRTISEDPR